jgi:hypothetical protein
MVQRTLAAVGVGGMLFLCSSEAVRSDPGAAARVNTPSAGAITAFAHQRAFLDANPGAAFSLSPEAGRIERVYGPAFSHGDTGAQSAEAFRLEHVRMLGAEPQDVVPVGPFPNGQHVQPISYQPATDTYKFTGYFYTQQRDGVPVFRSDLRLLVRNEGRFPLVLASTSLRDLGDFQVEAVGAPGEAAPASSQMAMKHVKAISELDGDPQVDSWRRVIWAGVEEMDVAPRLADEFIVTLDVDKWLVLTDAVTGNVLYEEHQIHFVDITGTVEGSCTIGIGAEQCEPEAPLGLPYIRVEAGANSAVSDVDGNFTISNPGSSPIDVTSTYDGVYFDVLNYLGGIETVTDPAVTPPGPAYLLFNSANNLEQVRAQANGYKYANATRDFILQHNPSYPVISTQTDFPVWVNRTDGYCPGNAWYDGGAINFCLSGSGYPNTAWVAVISHEYGHHLVGMGGSGQCEYGEGMSDVLGMLMLDDPCTGLGFFGDCVSCLRNADNSCQYDPGSCSSCGGPCHSCGQLISGCVWSTRNNMIVTEPSDYLTILSTIAIDAVMMHSGSSITSSITVDYLTLDDDNGNILDGTPHYTEINNGFSDHGLPGPALALLSFEFPEGLPELVSPDGGTTIPVHVVALSQSPQPGSGKMYCDTGSGYVEYVMHQTAPNEYDAVFPASDCASTLEYYFSASTMLGSIQLWPPEAPGNGYTTLSAVSVGVELEDDFETDEGWTTEIIGASSGFWQRGVPVNDPGWDYDPASDGDGSGQAFLTQNEIGNTDVDGGAVRLISPVFDMTGSGYQVAYEYYLRLTDTAGGVDRLLVEMSSNGDAGPWAVVATHDTDGGLDWRHHEIAQDEMEAAGVVFTANMKIRFTTNDADPQSINESGVDGFQLISIGCDDVAVPGDIDGNGVVDVNDFLLMLGAWGDCPDPCPPCPADVDGNCSVDVNDFLILLANWTS